MGWSLQRGRTLVALALGAAGLVAAGCGGSSPDPIGTTTGTTPQTADAAAAKQGLERAAGQIPSPTGTDTIETGDTPQVACPLIDAEELSRVSTLHFRNDGLSGTTWGVSPADSGPGDFAPGARIVACTNGDDPPLFFGIATLDLTGTSTDFPKLIERANEDGGLNVVPNPPNAGAIAGAVGGETLAGCGDPTDEDACAQVWHRDGLVVVVYARSAGMAAGRKRFDDFASEVVPAILTRLAQTP